jgi:hypothetical protein
MNALRGRNRYSFAFDASAPPVVRRGGKWLELLRSWGYFSAVMAIWLTICTWTVTRLMTVPRSLATIAARTRARVPATARPQKIVRRGADD